jgi:hypothetical protein
VKQSIAPQAEEWIASPLRALRKGFAFVAGNDDWIVVREQASKRLSGSLFFGCGGI